MTSLPGDQSVDWKESNSSWMFVWFTCIQLNTAETRGNYMHNACPISALSFHTCGFWFIFYVHRNRRKPKNPLLKLPSLPLVLVFHAYKQHNRLCSFSGKYRRQANIQRAHYVLRPINSFLSVKLCRAVAWGLMGSASALKTSRRGSALMLCFTRARKLF